MLLVLFMESFLRKKAEVKYKFSFQNKIGFAVFLKATTQLYRNALWSVLVRMSNLKENYYNFQKAIKA